MSSPDLYLSPGQTSLLRAALASNQPADKSGSPPTQFVSNPAITPIMSEHTAPGSGHLDFSDDSPFLDFGLDGEVDDSFQFTPDGQMIGDLPEESAGGHLHDKRKSIDGDDDDDEGGGKRREGDDKTAKKPGRKPLTSEPTNKRKAQNRAAQRAFRERKEKHLKDLETEVDELKKSSESTNHENGLLRAQVERLQIELREYRKRLSWISNGSGRSQQSLNQANRTSVGGNDFQFEFPKFGDLPAANFSSPNNMTAQQRNNSTGSSTQAYTAVKTGNTTVPRQSSVGSRGPGSTARSASDSPMAATANYTASPASQTFQNKGSVDSLTGLFSPSILEATRKNSLGYFPDNNSPRSVGHGRQSFDNLGQAVAHNSHSSAYSDSPGSTSDSQNHISSIGTSPEPVFNSPNNKQDFLLNPVSEDKQLNTFGKDDLCSQIQKACGDCRDPVPPMFSKSDIVAPGISSFTNDLNSSGFDWLAQQNGGNFDPVLFGDYRETQDNILSQDFGSFFNDAYPLPDLGSPMHSYGDIVAPSSETVPKPDLMKQVDAAKEGEEMVPADKGKMLTCNKIWDRLQSMEKFRNGEIDIDNLCSELRAKAKCSEGGAVVDEKHVNKLLGL